MTQPFNDPAPIGGVRPTLRDLEGRVVAFTPLLLEVVPNTLSKVPGATQKRITMDIMVIDGGPLYFGGNPTGAGNKAPAPHTLQVSTPVEFTGVYDSHQNVVSALERAVGNGVILGRVTRGITTTAGYAPPWNIAVLEPGDPGRQLAAQVWAAKMAGTWMNPVPQPIHGAPAPTLAHTYATTMPAAPAVVETLPTAPPNIPATVWATMTPDQRAAIAPPAAPVATLPAPPPGWTPELWATLNDEQRAAIGGVPAAPGNPF